MSTRYSSFDHFMFEVVKKADELADLNGLFEVKSRKVLTIILKIIVKGWWIFAALCAILTLSSIGFGLSLLGFLATPPGLIIAAVVGAGAYATLKDVYKNKDLPLAIEKIGSKYKPKYNQALDLEQSKSVKKIDLLFKDAVQDLISSAKTSPSHTKLQNIENWLKKYE